MNLYVREYIYLSPYTFWVAVCKSHLLLELFHFVRQTQQLQKAKKGGTGGACTGPECAWVCVYNYT